MLTTEALRALGADVDDGIRRCINNEAFYLKMVDKALGDLTTEDLRAALAAGDLTRAFELCHAMKGVLANLSLTPALTPASQLTELLRERKDMDYAPLTEQLEAQLQALKKMKED
jgi:HPt (histidine-containing phosphotransfer) domain-containing protein